MGCGKGGRWQLILAHYQNSDKLLATPKPPNTVTTTAVNMSPARNSKGDPGELEDHRELQKLQCTSKIKKAVLTQKAMHMPKKDLGKEKTPVLRLWHNWEVTAKGEV